MKLSVVIVTILTYGWKNACRGAAIVCIISLVTGCGYHTGSGEYRESTQSTDKLSASETVVANKELWQEDLEEEVRRKIEEISFRIYENPVDEARYDSQTDRVYKDAFLKAVTNRILIYDKERDVSVSYQDLLGSSGEMNEEEWLRYVRQSDFFYQDFDGDGLPELTVNTEGPCVLKYNAGEDRVELHYRKEPGWNLLGTGQMFYDSNYTDDKSDKGRSDCYAYEIAAGGRKKQSITFSDIWSYDGGTDWMDTYKVSVEGLEEIEVGEEEYRKLAGAYYRMVSLAPHPMSFLTVFGDGEDSGYVPGKGSKPRYLPEERDFLPINEKSGEEWEAYAAMMKGDFSLVEDERWTSTLKNK